MALLCRKCPAAALMILLFRKDAGIPQVQRFFPVDIEGENYYNNNIVEILYRVKVVI